MDRGKKIVEAMGKNTTPKRFGVVKNDGKNATRYKNRDHIEKHFANF